MSKTFGHHTTSDGVPIRVEDLGDGSHAIWVHVSNGVSDVTDPKKFHLTGTDVVAGGSVNLDSPPIPIGKTHKLLAVVVSSSVSCKWEIVSFDTTEKIEEVVFTQFMSSFEWNAPNKNFISLNGSGSAKFRVKVSNLDRVRTANVYVTIYVDEE